MSETQRCEPKDATVSGWHWIEDAKGDRAMQKYSAAPEDGSQIALWSVGDGIWSPRDMARRGYRYLCAVPTPAEIAALVDQASDALGELYLLGREHAGLVAALAAFPAKETTDGR